MGLGVAGKGPPRCCPRPPRRDQRYVVRVDLGGAPRSAGGQCGGPLRRCWRSPHAVGHDTRMVHPSDERHMTDWQACPSDSRCTLLFGMVDAANEARLV